MLQINATKRKEHGKSANRRLRLMNKFPAIIYAKNQINIPIELDQNIIFNIQTKDAFYKDLIIIVDGKNIKVIIKEIQRHPYKPQFIHIDFINQNNYNVNI